jgi:hypothetical protein
LNEVVRSAISQELKARCSVPEKLPDALLTQVNRLDDQQKTWMLSVVCLSNSVAPWRLRFASG